MAMFGKTAAKKVRAWSCESRLHAPAVMCGAVPHALVCIVALLGCAVPRSANRLLCAVCAVCAVLCVCVCACRLALEARALGAVLPARQGA